MREGTVSDAAIRQRMAAYFTESKVNSTSQAEPVAVSPVPTPDKNTEINPNQNVPHPPSPRESQLTLAISTDDSSTKPPEEKLSRDEVRFLADLASQPLSTTVSRYQRLSLSRRRGNAIRQHLAAAGVIEAVPLATRSGQVVLYQLTEPGRAACTALGIDPGPVPRASLEHQYWVMKIAEHFEKQGYEMTAEHPIPGDGAVDLLAERPGERVAIEVETGKSDIKANLAKLKNAGFDRVIMVATSPSAVSACQRALDKSSADKSLSVELMTWLDVG